MQSTSSTTTASASAATCTLDADIRKELLSYHALLGEKNFVEQKLRAARRKMNRLRLAYEETDTVATQVKEAAEAKMAERRALPEVCREHTIRFVRKVLPGEHREVAEECIRLLLAGWRSHYYTRHTMHWNWKGTFQNAECRSGVWSDEQNSDILELFETEIESWESARSPEEKIAVLQQVAQGDLARYMPVFLARNLRLEDLSKHMKPLGSCDEPE